MGRFGNWTEPPEIWRLYFSLSSHFALLDYHNFDFSQLAPHNFNFSLLLPTLTHPHHFSRCSLVLNKFHRTILMRWHVYCNHHDCKVTTFVSFITTGRYWLVSNTAQRLTYEPDWSPTPREFSIAHRTAPTVPDLGDVLPVLQHAFRPPRWGKMGAISFFRSKRGHRRCDTWTIPKPCETRQLPCASACKWVYYTLLDELC